MNYADIIYYAEMQLMSFTYYCNIVWWGHPHPIGKNGLLVVPIFQHGSVGSLVVASYSSTCGLGPAPTPRSRGGESFAVGFEVFENRGKAIGYASM